LAAYKPGGKTSIKEGSRGGKRDRSCRLMEGETVKILTGQSSAQASAFRPGESPPLIPIDQIAEMGSWTSRKRNGNPSSTMLKGKGSEAAIEKKGQKETVKLASSSTRNREEKVCETAYP